MACLVWYRKRSGNRIFGDPDHYLHFYESREEECLRYFYHHIHCRVFLKMVGIQSGQPLVDVFATPINFIRDRGLIYLDDVDDGRCL